jgi:hypothetical protein
MDNLKLNRFVIDRGVAEQWVEQAEKAMNQLSITHNRTKY